MSAIDKKSIFEQTFTTNYFMLKTMYPSQQEAAEKAVELARLIASGEVTIDDVTFQKWSLEMFMKYKVDQDVPKTYVMRADNDNNWFEPSMAASGFFWRRYHQYLSKIKNWPIEAVQAIDDTTNQILASIGNPNSMTPFDKRGLVLGYVQSGKTANFTGLINKAYDIGYKLIIVLSGIHNDLRAQTQIRLNEEVIGNRKDKDGNPIGVSQIYANTSEHIISSWTTEINDIKAGHGGTSHLNSRTLMVVKKNKTVLESLRDQLINHRDLYNLDIPVLIIDDEADQASVDTSDPNKNEDPKTINRLIRQILEIFNRKSFVGYTATPFANLLISMEGKTDEEGQDLYPKDFLVGLPKPKEYCGPEEYFNVEEDAEDPRPNLIRPLKQEDLDVFTTIKKKSDADKFDEVPPQMREAILAFLLVIAIRNLRGQVKKHNSMLIHTSRFKDVQSSVKDEVLRTFDAISKQLLYNPNSIVIEEMKYLYENDIQVTSREWPEEHRDFSWEEIHEELKKSCDSIQVFEINGNSKDALDYHQYKEQGLNVIAVGGDKLSRGLTLEGLSITYYFRNTLMYDTLMQMGRWFGYRKGYMDLCRIYTSEEIAANFEHLAIAMIQLRQEFDRLAQKGKTPSEYAVKMLSHPTMMLTSPLKMRNAVSSNVIYGGTLQQTRLFDNDEQIYHGNMTATENLAEKLQLERKSFKGKTHYYMASDVDASVVKEYLSEYSTAGGDKVDAEKISNYIDLANDKGELLNWTVAIVEGDPSERSGLVDYPVEIGDIKLNSAVARGINAKPPVNRDHFIDIKAIVSPSQEYIDLDPEKIKGLKDRTEKRRMRDMEKGLMLIYPLHPKVPVFESLNIPFSSNLVPIGIAFSFPDSEIDEKSVYQTNKTVQ